MRKQKRTKSTPIYDNSHGWIKEIRDWDLIHAVALKGHSAFLLLHIIALRAWRGPGTNERGCGLGECFIGDYSKWKFTKKGYRVAKKQLEELGLCSFRASNFGTVALLKTKDLFDINIDSKITEREQRAPSGHPRGTPGAPPGHLTRS